MSAAAADDDGGDILAGGMAATEATYDPRTDPTRLTLFYECVTAGDPRTRERGRAEVVVTNRLSTTAAAAESTNSKKWFGSESFRRTISSGGNSR